MAGDNSQENSKGFFSFIRSFLFPTFKILSFIGFICLVDIIMYIITISLGVQRDPNKLLAPLSTTLQNFGMKVNIKT